MTINVTTIWWWTGSYHILPSLKNIKDVKISAIVTMADDGGSAWRLRDEYGILPSGDVRKAILALSDEEKKSLLRQLFNYRFTWWGLGGHNLGNLIMMAMEDIAWSYPKAINLLEELFEIHGKVYPVSLEKIRLLAKLSNGKYIVGEKNIDIPKHDWSLKVEQLFVLKEGYAKAIAELNNWWIDISEFNDLLSKFISDKPKENPKIGDLLSQSDYILFCAGDFLSSIIPNMLVWNMREHIINSKAKKIILINLFTKYGETNGFTVFKYIKEFERYIGKDVFDYILVQDWDKYPISGEVLEKYQLERKDIVRVDVEDPRLIKADFVKQSDMARHDYKKVEKVLSQIIV